MALATFPAFRCIPVMSEDEELDNCLSVQRSRNGAVYTVDWGAEIDRYSFTVTAIGSEIETLRSFYRARRTDPPFNWTDREGVTHKVMFAGPLRGKKVAIDVVSFSVSLETVP